MLGIKIVVLLLIMVISLEFFNYHVRSKLKYEH